MKLEEYIATVEAVGKGEPTQDEVYELIAEFVALSQSAAAELDGRLTDAQANRIGVYIGLTHFLLSEKIPVAPVLFGLAGLVARELTS